ncbi:hypothetical protein [Mucilaginibacter ginsenosidivorax]|uniref:Uncharacterized protein n=1 Tax=Mucilaginibacter ginsenosidivorax TaxID=862126 RepID=A0A5B8W765_9SPHI|nr:hypothetical protein [Mucilaginibacter ginsenosidivorax]QEC78766.1 hypothetical protein FSB76_23480 [Mucilaginibacter ginsenosidivorax]
MPDNGEEKILINVGLNTDEANQGIAALGQKIDAVGKKDLGSTSVKSYKFQIRDLTAELQKIEQVQGRNSQAFRDGAKELGRLKLAARDFKDQIEAYDPSNKLAGIANIAKGAAVGMTGAAGAMALFGLHGQKAEEVMLKLQGVLALSHFLGSLHEISSGWRSFINVLGLGATAAKAQTTEVVEGAVEQVAATEAVTVAISEQQIASERLAAANEAVNQLNLDSEAALLAIKAEGLDATIGMTGAEQAYLETMAAKTAAVAELTAAQTAYDATLAAGTAESVAASEANVAQAATQELVTVAEEASTVAAVGFGTALKAIGIGLVISLIAYLVSNWDSLKKSIDNLFPSLGGTKGLFKETMEVVFGLGNVLIKFLKIPIDEIIAGVKILIHALSGDFKAAVQDFKDGVSQIASDLNVVDNYKEGAAKKAAKYAEEERIARVNNEILANERIIKVRKALGEDVTALEIKNQQLKNSVLDKDADDYKQKLADGLSEITVIQNTAIKKRQDEAEKLRKAAQQKADALKKSELDKLKAGNDAASKIILGGLKSQREIELSDSSFKYKALIAIATKYGKDASQLREAQGIEEARINKKYADQIKDYLEKSDAETLNDFDKKRLEITKAAEAALKNATPVEKGKIIQSQTFQLGRVDSAEKYSDAADAAQLNETKVTDANRARVGKVQDSPEVQAQKEQAIRNAKLATLTAQYQKERDLAAYNYDKLAQLDADYQSKTHDLEDEATNAKIELAQKEKDAKLATLQVVGDALQGAADIAGKATVAGKVLAVASATISTYLSAVKAYESVVGIPYVGPILAPIAAATAVAAGFQSVKSILAVKVPGSTGGSGSAPSYSAPQINSTVLNQAQKGVQQVQVVNQPDPKKQEPVRAFVVEKDITSKQDRANYLDRQSTI